MSTSANPGFDMLNSASDNPSSDPPDVAQPARQNLLFDIVPFVVAVLLAGLCCGLFVRRGLGLPILGYDISPAERVLNGEVPYRDFLYNYTPGVLWLNAALMKLFGVSLLTVNFALFAFKLGALIVLFVIARRLTCPW
ncbi:MAG TPA: hypothetical protein VKM94_19445, partial [Blastocatellia bacterium]|nr:hypothetical protein [Blastocatellia bacterium]